MINHGENIRINVARRLMSTRLVDNGMHIWPNPHRSKRCFVWASHFLLFLVCSMNSSGVGRRAGKKSLIDHRMNDFFSKKRCHHGFFLKKMLMALPASAGRCGQKYHAPPLLSRYFLLRHFGCTHLCPKHQVARVDCLARLQYGRNSGRACQC